jgi:hypothetical protein
MDSITFDWSNILTQATAPISTLEFLVTLALTAITAFVVKRIYVRFGNALSNRSGFGNIFVPLAMTTMIIITIVKSSLALSLGLVGALSIVRFRAAIKEPEELVYLFICIAIGLGFGANQISITIIGVFSLVIAVALIRRASVDNEDSNVIYLTISKQSEEGINFNKIFDLLKDNTLEADLKRLDDTPNSNEVSFVLSFANESDILKLRDDLISLDKNMQVTFLDNTKIF